MKMLFKDDKDTVYIDESKGTPIIKCRMLEKYPVKHGFSTKDGGASKGIFATMNTSFSRGDDPLSVMENYRRIGDAIGVKPENMVLTKQTHTVNVVRVSEEDMGNGITKPQKFSDVDGLITNTPGVCLVSSHADCVPLFFVDPVKKAIGLSHSGWRGSVNRMGEVTVKAMAKEFGTEPSDIVAFIGPSVCKDCYEVGQDVIDCINENMQDILERYKGLSPFIRDDHNGKYHLDMWEMNRRLLMSCGIKEENIAVTNICTACNPDHLWSHRKHGKDRGGLAAFLCLE